MNSAEIDLGEGDAGFVLGEGPVGILLIHGLTGTPTELRQVAKGLAKAGQLHGVRADAGRALRR